MVNHQLSTNFSSKINNVKVIVNDILAFLKEQNPALSDNDYYDLKLIYSELLINAVVHGNHNEIMKQVSVTTDFFEDGTIAAEITDEGTGFDLTEVLNRKSALEESGRGICIAVSLADEFTCHKKENGTQILFKKKVTL